MNFVVQYIKMVSHDGIWIHITWVKVWITHLRNMYKNSDLVIMQVHKLHFILNLKTIVFNEVYD
jgi:hypothetical protein